MTEKPSAEEIKALADAQVSFASRQIVLEAGFILLATTLAKRSPSPSEEMQLFIAELRKSVTGSAWFQAAAASGASGAVDAALENMISALLRGVPAPASDSDGRH